MKKGIIVLLIAVLVAGFAFAGTLTGSASISFGADLDAKTFGFKNAQAWKYSFSFEFDSTKVEVGDHQTELWAEIAAKASANITVNKSAQASGDVTPSYSVSITKANIHINEFTFGILNMGTGPDYAASYYKTSGTPDSDILKGPSKNYPGFTVEYKGYKAGFGLTGSWADEEFKIQTAGWAETKAFTFGENDEISAQAGAYALYYTGALVGAPVKNAGIALKGAYKADKLTASAAADLQIQREAGKNSFVYEVAASAAYTINDNGSAGLDVYLIPAADKLQLDAQLWAKYNFKFDEVTLATTATVDARNILADAREITVKATEALTILDGKLALSFGETYTIFAKTLKLTAKATYTAEKFTAWAAINDASMSFADGFALTALKPEVGISTKAIIENAELSCVWTGANFVKAEDAKKVGSITAKAEISF